MRDTILKLAKKATIVLAIFFNFLFGCKDKKVDPHLLTDNGMMIYFSSRPYYPPWSNVPKSIQENDARLPRVPACDSLPVEHFNFKVSLHKATPSESPLAQNCNIISDSYGSNIGIGSKIVVDVSYYKGVKKVRIPVSTWNNSLNIKSSKAAYVILKDSDGKVIASDSIQTDDAKTLLFNDNLEKLREIIVINCNSERLGISYVALFNKCCD